MGSPWWGLKGNRFVTISGCGSGWGGVAVAGLDRVCNCGHFEWR
jgi:hypothetical protein